MKKKIIRTIFSIIGIIAALCAAVIVYFAIRGAVMWNDAKAEKPIGTVIEQLQSADDFTVISELPEFYINAVISVEDRKFRTHNGINLKSIARALLYDIKSLSFEQGDRKSTRLNSSHWS